MKQKYIYSILLLFGLLASASMQAVKHYSCDFENQADRDRWVLNKTANQQIYNNLTNKWYIGQPGNNGQTGQNGLYISDDGGATAHYANKGCWVMAYDTVSLDHLSTSADYTLSFDYMGMGNVASNFDGLYLLWVPMTDPDTGDSIKILSIATSSGIPGAYNEYVVQLQPQALIDYLNAAQTWKQCVVNIPNKKCDGKPHYLVFVWANTGNAAQQPGGKIDNIEISDSRPCEAPAGLTLTIQGTTSLLSWSGSAGEYEVSAYSYEDDKWYGPQLVQTTQASFSNLPIGQTDFIVRAKCASDLYSLKAIISKLVYYPDQMCVDYLNLDKATCYIGTGFDNTTTFNNYQKVSPVDEGPGSNNSRHTIHFDKAERDPRSNGLLPVIPPNELASVRLGNVQGGNQTERIEYSFLVDTLNYPVLLLKYAPILEAPTHEDYKNPRFMLDILIGTKSIGHCGQADFNANTVRAGKDEQGTTTLTPEAIAQGWHVTPKAYAQANGDDVIWKEWTTVGVNLKNPTYQGKKLTVRLTTFDCAYTQHGGYAYFTLGCSDGKLQNMKCGEINEDFVAPDGFNYRWYVADAEQYRDKYTGEIPEQYIRSHTQTFNAGPKNDTLYAVDCMFVQDSSCYFTLLASSLATNPVSIIGNKPSIQKDCGKGLYHVQFDGSKSWVQEIDHVTGDTITSRYHHIDRLEWKVNGLQNGWSDKEKPTFDFPASGGDWTISLTTYSGICDSTVYYHLHLDELKETRDTTTIVLCDDVRKTTGYTWEENEKHSIHGKIYRTYGLDSIKLYNEASSCDSILYLNLLEPVRVPVEKVVLPDNLPFVYRGRKYYESTIDTIPNMLCDTTWILNLTVYDNLKVEMPDTFKLCGNDNALTLQYKITQGFSTGYTYSFTDSSLPTDTVEIKQLIGEHEIVIPLNPTPRPNQYEGSLKLFDSIPWWSVTLPFKLLLRYDSAIVEQKWNDVLYVLAPDYNGNYEFTAFQWYRNDTLLEGETRSYLYQDLDMNAEYYVELTRADDGVVMASCPITPTNRPQSADYPSILSMQSSASPGQRIQVRLSQPAKIWFYSVSGQIYAVYSLSEGDSTITAPLQRGMYIVKMMDEQGEVKAQRLLVR